jgi:hypothetical protein
MNFEDLRSESSSGCPGFVEHVIHGKSFSFEVVFGEPKSENFGFPEIIGYVYYINRQVVDEATYHEAYQDELTKLNKSTR